MAKCCCAIFESKTKVMKQLQIYVIWAGYSLGSLLVSLWLAWQLSAQLNFLYPLWYSVLNIDQTIEETMPKHLYKKEFIATNTEEHHRLFEEIVSSVQSGGRGLAEIKFYTPDGNSLGALLTESEIIHLQDVAKLVDLLGWFALVLVIFCLMTMAAIIFFRLPMPAIKKLTLAVTLLIAMSVSIVLFVGAKKFFYWLHAVVFPSDHQWFFYYEESLMSTLMKAPDLFAPISVMLLAVGLLIWLTHLVLLQLFAGFKTV